MTRLSTADASFYRLENTATPMYVGSLSILRRPRSGLSYETLLATIEQRLPQIPRYRQKVREVKFGMARPVWIDDRDFDITYHVRRSALPSPGSDEQLHELIARLAARPGSVWERSGKQIAPHAPRPATDRIITPLFARGLFLCCHLLLLRFCLLLIAFACFWSPFDCF